MSNFKNLYEQLERMVDLINYNSGDYYEDDYFVIYEGLIKTQSPKLAKNLLKTNPKDKKIISKIIFYTIKQCSQNPKEIFPILYFILIGEKQGPRISDIIATYGIKKTTDILKRTSLI